MIRAGGRDGVRACEAVDVVYRWCAPERPSGDGQTNRSRDNRELTYSLSSVAAFMPWVRKVFIVFAGRPPDLDAEPPFRFEGLRARITFVDERDLFAKAQQRYGIEVVSNNSEPVKLCLPFLEELAPRFVLMDDDFILMQPLGIALFADASGLPLYPPHILHPHRPLLFVTADVASWAARLSDNEKRTYLCADKERRDPLPAMVTALCATGRARFSRHWLTLSTVAPLEALFEVGPHRAWSRDWSGLTFFVMPKGKGQEKTAFVRRMLARAARRRPYSLCVNDDWDDEPAHYQAQMAVYRGFMNSTFGGST